MHRRSVCWLRHLNSWDLLTLGAHVLDELPFLAVGGIPLVVLEHWSIKMQEVQQKQEISPTRHAHFGETSFPCGVHLFCELDGRYEYLNTVSSFKLAIEEHQPALHVVHA